MPGGIYSAYQAGRPITKAGSIAEVKVPPHPLDRAERMLSSAAGIYSDLAASERAYRMAEAGMPQKNIGGALMSGASTGLMAAQAGTALTEAGHAAIGGAVGGPWGMAIGFGLGMMAYLMS